MSVEVTQADREAAKRLAEYAGFQWSADHLDMAIEAAAQAFARHRSAAEAEVMTWQSIDNAPRNGTWILCWGVDAGYGVAKFHRNPIWAEYPDYTHWMPLPPPPETEG